MVGARNRFRESLRSGGYLAHVVVSLLVLFPQFLEKWMLQYLRGSVALVWVVNKHLCDYVLCVRRHMWDQLLNSYELLRLEVELHVCCVSRQLEISFLLLEVVQKLRRRRAHYVMDLVNLVELIVTRKEGKERKDLEEDTASSPNVHLVPVVTIGQQALRGPVPPS